MAILPTDAVSTPEDPVPSVPATPDENGQVIRAETLVGGLLFLSVLAYIGLYQRGVMNVERYKDGFIIDRCPVCQKGAMHVDVRQTRVMGIPRPKRAVRCDTCRSVLRETGHRRWRYAVDPLGNPAMYERFNGREIDEQALVRLSDHPIRPNDVVSGSVTPPSFVEGEEEGE